MEIFASHDFTDVQRNRMQDIADGDVLHFFGEFENDDHIPDVFPDCEVVFGNLPAAWLTKTRKLQWKQLISVGFGEYAHLDWPKLGRQITVTNLAGFFAHPVAETALGGILSLFRGIDELSRLKTGMDWQKDPLRETIRLLDGAAVVMVGFGSINRRLAELLEPFHCHITTLRSQSTTADVASLLPGADIVVCAAPDTDLTRGIFDKQLLAQMKRDAIFVNLGRGSIVDEHALAQRLRSGQLGGAVLDVTDTEPLPEDHPLWQCPRTILTQHTGGGTTDEVDRKIEMFARNMSHYRSGQPMIGAVDWEKGY